MKYVLLEKRGKVGSLRTRFSVLIQRFEVLGADFRQRRKCRAVVLPTNVNFLINPTGMEFWRSGDEIPARWSSSSVLA